MIYSTVLMLGMVTFACTACGCRDRIDENAIASEASVSAKALRSLDQSQRDRLGIVVTPVRREMIAVTKSAVGWLEAPPASQIVVRSPVTGFIVANPTLPWPNLGQKVERDSSLANVNIFLTSQEISQLVIAKDDNDIQMQQALVTMQLSEAQLAHVTTARDAVPGVRIDQLKESLAHSKVAFKEAQDKLPYLVQEPYEDGLLVKPICVKSTTAGRVLHVHVALGQFVLSGDPLWTIADWSTLWVRVPLFESDARLISTESVATVRDDLGDNTKVATPVNVPTESKPTTRTTDFYFAVDNVDWRLRVGQAINVDFPIGGDRESTMIPRSALLYNEFGQAVCYALMPDSDQFIKTRIELGACQGDSVEVIRGLDADSRVVSVGAQQLAAEEGKADLAVGDDD